MSETLDLDVVIVGGGVMGLWLANDLHEGGYRFALLERNELGGEQTCHSHVYIHQGYIYNREKGDLAARLKSVTGRWQEWLQTRTGLIHSDRSYFGFRNEADFTEKRTLWEKPELGLKYNSVPESEWPRALRAGTNRASAVKILVSAPEHCLDGELLVKELYCDAVRENSLGVVAIDWVRVDPQEIEIIARARDRRAVRMRSRFLVFAAGVSNLGLIGEVFPEKMPKSPDTHVPQQIRKSHMLVIRGATEDLPPLNGVFRAFDGLFLVSRKLGAETVWLVSDHRSEAMENSGDWGRYGRRWWLPRVIGNLQELSPAVLDRVDRLSWGVYEAPKAEGYSQGNLPLEERILPMSSNAFVVWPTKLTLAPQASRALVAMMNAGSGRGPGLGLASSVGEVYQRPEPAAERWVSTPVTDWRSFKRDWEDAKGVGDAG